ncbi:hypothetical protein EZV62_004758 [Acer yangbiense]|uniref:Transposase MuDR plant domain-containing protein n=1 Tax=Acer yangbiense TaxID=1000413 RepID=A0A5C7IKL5_9ROSI|nr:hypothetical protein EZV62_004758 [Acer yangbiense]
MNCGSPNIDGEGEGDISSEFDASDHSHASGDDDLVGNTTIQRGSSTVYRPWIILGSEQYSFQTINHKSSTTDGQFYKGIIFSSKKELKRDLRLLALKQHFEIRIRRSNKGRFEATCKDDNCSFKVHARKLGEGESFIHGRQKHVLFANKAAIIDKIVQILLVSQPPITTVNLNLVLHGDNVIVGFAKNEDITDRHAYKVK